MANKLIKNTDLDKDIIIQVNDGGVTTTVMTVDGATSRVGIGTTSPSRLFHVLSSTDHTYGRFESTGVGLAAGVQLKGTTQDWLIQADSAHAGGSLAFYSLTNSSYQGSVTNAGAWTFGPPSGNTTHTVTAGSGTVALNVDTTNAGTSAAVFRLKNSAGAANDIFRMAQGGGELKFTDGALTQIGKVNLTAGGSWSFGPANPTNVQHTFQGRVDITWSGGSSGLVLANTDTGGGDTPQMIVTSADTAVNSSAHILQSLRWAGDNDATGALFIEFRDGDGQIGSISAASATTVAFNTSSDARLKTNIVDFSGGIALMKQIKPRSYNWIQDGHADKGFIAQELYEVYPEAVKKGEEDVTQAPWQVDYGKLTPVLAAAIKELIQENEELKAYKVQSEDRLATLEARLNNAGL